MQSNRENKASRYDDMVVQFGWDQIKGLSETGIQLKKERTRIRYDGEEYRVVEVNDYGQKYNRNYMPGGLIELKIRRRMPEDVN